MSQRLLILESDVEFAARMKKALQGLDSYSVTVKANLKDACVHINKQRQTLAFVPVTKDDKVIWYLRLVQPDLRIVVMTPAAEYKVPAIYAGEVQGVLIKSHLEADLAKVLDQALSQPFPLQGAGANGSEDETILDKLALEATLRQANISQQGQTAIFTQGTKLLAHWGELKGSQAAAIALQVGEGWEDTSPTTRIQFMHLPARPGDMLLYTRRIDESYRLTLVSSPETPLTILRIQSDSLVDGLREIVAGHQFTALADMKRDVLESGDRKCHVIAWQSMRPVPTSFNIPLRQSFEQLASANGCVLKEVIVHSELVQIVISCPSGRDGPWAAYLLKNGSEAAIREEFDLENGLWKTGYYTKESAELLSEAEVNIFLEQDSSE